MLLACATNLWADAEVIYKNEGAVGTVGDITATGNVNTKNGNPAPSMACTTEKNTTFTFSGFQLTEYTNLTLKLDVKKDFASTTNTWPYITVTTYLNDKEVMTDNTTISWSEKATGYTTFTLSSLQPFDKITLVCSPAIGISGSGKSTTVYTCYIDNITLTGERASSATLQSIEITGEPTKKDYMAGEAFSTNGLKVMGNYDNATQKEITEGITWTVTPATLTAGTTQVSVTATAEGKSTTRTITGLTVTAAKTLTSIAVSGTPAEFWKGDIFNHNGMTVTAKWDDNSTTDVTTEATFSTPDMTTAGTKTITVTYKEKTTTYDITVKTIANTQETAYTVAEAIALIDAGKDLTTEVFVKGIVSEIVTPWSTQYKNITYNISDDGATTSAQFQLFRCETNGAYVGDKVTAKGKMKKHNETTYEFDAKNTIVAIVPKTVTSIAISGEAETTNYYAGQTFDPAGLVVTATFEDESTADVTELVDWTFDPAVLEEGTTKVSVSATYKELNATVVVTVTVGPAPKIVTIDLTKDETTTATADKLEWAGPVLTITAAKGEATTDANNYYGGDSNNRTSTRFYKSSTLTFTPVKGITLESITYKATTDDYATAMATSTWTNATVSVDGTTVTITPKDGEKAVSAKIGGTTGGTSFVINYSGEASATAIDNAAVETPAVKTIENGQLVIIRDGVKYNAMGVRLQ